MLRKISLIAAIFAALMLPGAAMAKHGGGHHGHHGHIGGRGHGHMNYSHGHGNWHRGHGHYGNWNRGRHWHGHYGHWRGHGRYWHGQWWGYGVGSCWLVVPGGWVWICN
jgi:hypothetical protein